MDISRRKRRILQEIITLYTLYGDPVGSTLVNQLLDELSVSSATIRNDMADLTSLGLLEQPYTSAGRIPTISGFRYYVDNLLRTVPLRDEERQYINDIIVGMDPDPAKSAELATRALVKLTGLAAIATTPRGGNINVSRYEVIRCGKFNIGVIGITGIGGMQSRVCRVKKELSEDQLAEVAEILNKHFVFLSAEDLSSRMLEQFDRESGENRLTFKPIFSAATSIIESLAEVKTYFDGQQHLLSFSELDDTIRQVLDLFSDTEVVCRALEFSGSLRISVGGAFGIDQLGMVIVRYNAAGGRYGMLAVTGPVRMDYGFVIPRLSYFRDRLSDELTSPI